MKLDSDSWGEEIKEDKGMISLHPVGVGGLPVAADSAGKRRSSSAGRPEVEERLDMWGPTCRQKGEREGQHGWLRSACERGKSWANNRPNGLGEGF